jgi:hypothetical protein
MKASEAGADNQDTRPFGPAGPVLPQRVSHRGVLRRDGANGESAAGPLAHRS